MLWMYQRVFYGVVKLEVNRNLPDLSGRERLAMWPAAVLALVMGVASPIWINSMESSVRSALAGTLPPQAMVKAADRRVVSQAANLVKAEQIAPKGEGQ